MEKSTASVLPVINSQTTETLEQSPPSLTNMQTAETSLPQVSNTHTTELSAESTSATSTQTTETLVQSTVPLLANTKTTETIEQLVTPEVTGYSYDNSIASHENHQGMEMRQEIAAEEEEIRSVLKVIAATGKFWYDWEKLRSMLSLHLKQVISEYPQAKMTNQEQKMSSGETHAELVKRLDDALHSFVDGPPFTLQRLSEIILDAQNMYPNLSKLALALEKNLSVTSTLTISTHPYPTSPITTPNKLNKVTEDPNPNSQMQSVTADKDEVMTEVDADVSDVKTMDMETIEKPSESSLPMTTTDIGSSSGVLVQQPTGISKL